MGKEVEVIGQNEVTQTIIDRFGVHDKHDEIEKVIGGTLRIENLFFLSLR